MPKFTDIVASPPGSKFILQGNAAFALGVVHAGYHAADGYPGTPSTEVIDKSLKYVQDKIKVGWDVSEAVAVSVAFGHAIAGFDAVVTMKIPGVFQAADVISSSAFFSGEAGAFVIYVASDYAPSSTQHVIDPRYFFSSLFIPVLEPRDHQEMYDIAFIAADISRQFRTPVVVLASGTLAHSEGLVALKQSRIVEPRQLPNDLKAWMCMPHIARNNYNKTITEKIPAIEKWIVDSFIHNSERSEESGETEPSEGLKPSEGLIRITLGADDVGIVTCGVNDIILKEALIRANLQPHILSFAITNPVPKNIIKKFYESLNFFGTEHGNKKGNGQVFVIEDGYRFLWEKIRALGFNITGKNETSTITEWTPDKITEFLSSYIELGRTSSNKEKSVYLNIKPLVRPPSICPGCPYRAVALTIQKLRRKKKIYASFGDIGCSTLLYYFNALDTVVCMGASDAIRQGFVLSRPEMANKVLSIIGDSTECHSGLDATRNSVFRNVPGVKIIFDNRITAMTGGQVAPSSSVNLAGENHNFNLRKAIEAEGCRTVVVDGFNLNQVDTELKQALTLADEGIYSVLIVEGDCINEIPKEKKERSIEFNYEICVNCGICNICPGIELDENKKPSFTVFCTDCGSYEQLCKQVCPIDGAITSYELEITNEQKSTVRSKLTATERKVITRDFKIEVPDEEFGENLALPDSIRVAIRGIGGQGNLFFGKVLTEVVLRTPYSKMRIVKGDTHGMAQLGGSVISIFSCGDVFSPVLASNTVDILVAMEINEVLMPGFIELLKPNGTLILNDFRALPANTKPENYPDFNKIISALNCYNIIVADFYEAARELGDVKGITANVVAIGLLSTIQPCCNIRKDIWIDALKAISPNEVAMNANIAAFIKGREKLSILC